MTMLQKEIRQKSEDINRMGYLMGAGLMDINSDNESIIQRVMTIYIVENEENRKRQEEAFNKMPWLKKLREK